MKKVLMTLMIVSVLLVSMGAVMAAKPADTGFDEFGYNYQARIFVGAADGVDRILDGAVWGDPNYANDHLVMKWSKAWDDARFHGADWTPEAWVDNEWNGNVPGGSGESEHVKIVWVGPEQYDLTGTWNLVFNYGGSYLHTMQITSFDRETGDFTGTGVYSDPSYTWTVSGNLNLKTNVVTYHILYTGTNAGYTVDATGILSGNTFTGTWSNAGQSGSWTGTGIPITYNSCGRDESGGYRIWGEFLAIMDHGIVDGEHQWWTHAKPTGYGA